MAQATVQTTTPTAASSTTPINGLAVYAAGAELLPYKYQVGELGPDEVEVRITHCGVCHTGVHLIDNDWGISKFPFIPGRVPLHSRP